MQKCSGSIGQDRLRCDIARNARDVWPSCAQPNFVCGNRRTRLVGLAFRAVPTRYAEAVPTRRIKREHRVI